VHAGGILITEKPVHYFTATELPPKGFPITQFDMISAEDIGLYKFDILSQRGLGHIRDSVKIVKQNKGIDVDVHTIVSFKSDPKIRALIREGKTMGCFYVESPAMRMLLSKLKCQDYKTLVAASSIIRPGVARSGMMREYIQRFHHPNDYQSIHPKMDELMEETFGVMVYQEDVIKVAHHFAGLTLAESDILRRGMSGKYRSRAEFTRLTEKFMSNCREKAYPDKVTKEVWRQIESFAGYSFSKAHSASYAVESYQSLFLKAHYPKEFMVAVINNFGGFYRTEFYVHEARMAGAEIRHPSVNHSNRLTSIEGDIIYLGFIHIKSLERKVIHSFLTEREANGPFLTFEDFVDRNSISLDQLTILVRACAFDSFTRNKKQLMVKANLMIQKNEYIASNSVIQEKLFTFPRKQWKLPELHYDPMENAYDDIELMGFPLINPFDLLIEKIDDRISSRELSQYYKRVIIMYGYLVTIKNTVTIKKDRMQFGTFLDSDGYFFDTTHFPDTTSRYPFVGRGVYRIKGRVTSDFGFYSLEVIAIQKMGIRPDPRYS
jgi:DNA polymerase-3 subunit alpha